MTQMQELLVLHEQSTVAAVNEHVRINMTGSTRKIRRLPELFYVSCNSLFGLDLHDALPQASSIGNEYV